MLFIVSHIDVCCFLCVLQAIAQVTRWQSELALQLSAREIVSSTPITCCVTSEHVITDFRHIVVLGRLFTHHGGA